MTLRRVPLAIVLVGWVAAFAISAYDRLLPATSYIDVKSVFVSDTVVDVPPAMEVDRVIHRDFTGTWRVEVEKLQKENRYSLFCSASGESNYSQENDLPSELNLDWWTYPEKCTPSVPGEYRLETVWSVNVSENLQKRLRVVSNTFRVRPRS